jgi:hypothetical protein
MDWVSELVGHVDEHGTSSILFTMSTGHSPATNPVMSNKGANKGRNGFIFIIGGSNELLPAVPPAARLD